MDIDHLQNVLICVLKYFLIFSHFLSVIYHFKSLLHFFSGWTLITDNSLSFSHVHLWYSIRKLKSIITDLNSKREISQLDIGSSHVQVELEEKRFSHIGVNFFFQFLAIVINNIVISINNKKLFILLFKVIESVFFLLFMVYLFLTAQIKVNFRFIWFFFRVSLRNRKFRT